MALDFHKYHGIGNDFLVIEVGDPGLVPIERVRRLCHRHFGVGGDGVLLVSPARSAEARATMTVINADGSVPEMCGNGLRCVALHLVRQTNETEAQFVVDTGAGPLACRVELGQNGPWIGTEIGHGTPLGELTVEERGESWKFFRMSTGNPHAICFRDPIAAPLLDHLGPRVSSQIEGGANVEIVTVKSPTELSVAVWERGVGRTLACGTGAAASAIEAVRQGRAPEMTPLLVHLPGGTLEITVRPDGSAYLRGPAQWVFSGRTEL